MTTLRKDLLSLGNSQSLKAFEENGGFINREPIREYERFQMLGMQGGIEYGWNLNQIGFDILPTTMMAYKSTSVNNNDNFIIRLRTQTNALIWELNLAGMTNRLGNAFVYNFDEIPASKEYIISFETDEFVDVLVVAAKKVFVNPPIAATIIVLP